MRGIGCDFAHELHHAFNLFWSDYSSVLAQCPDVSILKTGIHTVVKVTDLHHSRAETHEENAFFFILCIVLAYNNVHGCFGGSIQSTILNLETVNQVEVGVTAGNGDDLLDIPLFDKRDKEIEEMDVADDVGLE